jgi:8-oxo-dGTP pyrophosphatase MutT (NUDIX family)
MNTKQSSPEITTLESNIVYQNNWMTVREDKIRRQSGSEGIYGVVDKADFVVVLAIDHDDIYLVEQYRYPIKSRELELPQGGWEGKPNANPDEIAKGELREECGVLANRWQYIGKQYLAYGFASQCYHIYIATDLTKTSQQLDEEEEGLTVHKLPLSEFKQKIIDGTIQDATTVNAYGLARLKGFIE